MYMYIALRECMQILPRHIFISLNGQLGNQSLYHITSIYAHLKVSFQALSFEAGRQGKSICQ